jgi:four helix bundle protein
MVESKSKAFAVRIVRLYQFLTEQKREFVLSKQLLRAGTRIGANIREGTQAFSRNDFVFKMNTALKECNETCYWLEILYETDYLSQSQFDSIYADANELFRLLTSIVKTAKLD